MSTRQEHGRPDTTRHPFRKSSVRAVSAELKHAAQLLPRLVPKSEIDKAERDARQLLDDQHVWSRALEIVALRDRAVEQISILQDCEWALSEAQVALSVGVVGPHSDGEPEELAEIRHALHDALRIVYPKGDVRIGDALRELAAYRHQWKKIQTTVANCRLRYYAVDALRFFSDRSGVESGSVIFAAIVVMGAAYSLGYSAAIGVGVTTYWTMEDLLLTGSRTIVFGVLAFWVTGRVFAYAQNRILRDSNGAHGSTNYRRIVQQGPSKFLLLGTIVATASSVAVGNAVGRYDVGWLRDIELDETALLTNGELVRNVKLVSTTSRAAIFLADKANRGMITLDRANIICLATGKRCEDLKPGKAPERAITVMHPTPYPELARFDDVHLFARQILGCEPAATPHGFPEALYFAPNEHEKYLPCPNEGFENSTCEPFQVPPPMSTGGGSTSLMVVGFSSSQGAYDYNLNLSERRATQVAADLRRAGWQRVETISLGESLFVNRTATDGEADWMDADRRVEILACSVPTTVAAS